MNKYGIIIQKRFRNFYFFFIFSKYYWLYIEEKIIFLHQTK